LPVLSILLNPVYLQQENTRMAMVICISSQHPYHSMSHTLYMNHAPIHIFRFLFVSEFLNFHFVTSVLIYFVLPLYTGYITSKNSLTFIKV